MSAVLRAGPAPPAPRRAALAGCVRALLVPLPGLAALVVGWTLAGATGWGAAGAAVAVWAAGSALWLRRQAWPPALVPLVTWAVPAALLAPLAVLGWLPADGLVLWSPLTTVLVVLAVAPPPVATAPA
ncbi:hypothetical protein ACI8AD_24925, partial [Geodermatophilus sp. SYSU D00766]